MDQPPLTYWITGASSGIGLALGRRLAAQGGRVAVSARSADKLEELANDPLCGGRIDIFPLDVTDTSAVAATVQAIQTRFGRIDCAVLNAGTYKADSGYHFSAGDIRHHMEVNFLSHATAIEALLPIMRAQGGGHIALMASVAGYRGLPRSMAYSASKAAVITLAEALRNDAAGMNIHIQVICPGFVRTPLTDLNDFPMPFLISVDEAAESIARRLTQRHFEIVFPRRAKYAMKIIRYLPYSLFFKMIALAGGGRK